MSDNQSNNKRIAKNTIMLYFRMIFTMLVSFYTSRVVLQQLGVIDYGIYNVVGGVVSMFTVLSNAMAVSTQRYMTFALGSNNLDYLKNVFSNSIFTHLFLAIIIIIITESVGLWFLYNKLVIPDDRLSPAFWVMQCSLLTICVSIISVPYNALIVAHEKMSAFAYISIIEVLLKLGVAYTLLMSSADKLVLYAILLLCIQIGLRLIYSYYCNKNFKESKIQFIWNASLFKEMVSFAGWNMMGTIAGMLYTQGVNIILNIFFGPVVNAARAVAVQVQGAILQFSANFQMAINPQITKTYAANEMNKMHSLIIRSSRYSFYLLLLIIVPIMIETPCILSLWLKDVPEWTVSFIRLMLLIIIVDTLSNPLMVSVQATGNVRNYQMIVSFILMLILPFSYMLLNQGYNPTSVFFCQLVFSFIAYKARLLIVRKRLKLSLKTFYKEVVLNCMIGFCVSMLVPYLCHAYLFKEWPNNLLLFPISVIWVALSIYAIGLTKIERAYIIEYVKKYLRK